MSEELTISKIRLLEHRAFRSKPYSPRWYAAWKNYHEALRLGYRERFGQAPDIDSRKWLDYEAWEDVPTHHSKPHAPLSRL